LHDWQRVAWCEELIGCLHAVGRYHVEFQDGTKAQLYPVEVLPLLQSRRPAAQRRAATPRKLEALYEKGSAPKSAPKRRRSLAR
jgi:hypothetical protein